MKTRINLYDHAAGLRDSIEVPLTRDETVHRLRQAIGEPQFFTEDGIAIYARVDTEPITMHVFSCSTVTAAGAWNEVINVLTRRALT